MKKPLWAVYRIITKKFPEGTDAVGWQEEWDALELTQPGLQPLIQGGIASEGVAERIARGRSGDSIEHRPGTNPREAQIVERSSAPGA